MHTILGANGIIGEELAKVLSADYGQSVKLVGRHPQKVNAHDELFVGDLLKKEDVIKALDNTEIAYLTVGLPFKSEVWLRDWERILSNVIDGCQRQRCKLVYFDNTYAYPQDQSIQREDTPFSPGGKKGLGKKKAAELLLEAMQDGHVEAVICRAPEFYGPGKTKSVTNSLIFDSLRKGKKPRIFLRDDVKRTLIYTPDASRAMALVANTQDTYSQTWHLPCDDNRLTYREMIDEISHQLGRKIEYQVLSMTALKTLSLVNANIKETMELMPRYYIDNLFESNKFKMKFPDFEVTTYSKGIEAILNDFGIE